jgi:AcrR family transcriptional regulator
VTAATDDEVRQLLAAADAAYHGGRRDEEAERPLGPKGVRTRAAILQAAYRRFVADGYGRSTVPQISADAGVALGTFYLYFRDKADVVKALAGELVVRFTTPLLQQADVDDVDQLSVEPYVRGYEAAADFQRVWEELTHIDPALAALRRDVTRLLDRRLERRIRHLQGAGRIDPHLDAATAATAVNAMADRYCYLSFVIEGRRGPTAVAAAVATLDRLGRAARRAPGAGPPSEGGGGPHRGVQLHRGDR